MIAVRDLPAEAEVDIALDALIAEARETAWWTHVNLSSRDLYHARKAAFARLREAIAATPGVQLLARREDELGYLIKAARLLASCSDSNRMGVPYYERKAAMAQLRGCLAAYDRAAAGR